MLSRLVIPLGYSESDSSPDPATSCHLARSGLRAAGIAGVFTILGCLLALKLEMDGFGRERDTGLDLGYIAPLIVAIIASLALPAVAFLGLIKGSRRSAVIVAAIAAVVCGVALFGL